jgi:hypothetical protein
MQTVVVGPLPQNTMYHSVCLFTTPVVLYYAVVERKMDIFFVHMLGIVIFCFMSKGNSISQCFGTECRRFNNFLAFILALLFIR